MENSGDFGEGSGSFGLGGNRVRTEDGERGGDEFARSSWARMERPERADPFGSRERANGDVQAGFTTVATLIGRKWHLVILDQLLAEGAIGFSALLRRIDGISSKVLSESLTDLEYKGFIARRVVSDRPFRVEYSLTNRGYSLQPILDMVHAGFDDAPNDD
jgi:DNA-binding HxlR family transcriptional regulator